jgi:hypothetical protein
MRKKTPRVRTREIYDVTVNTRTSRDIQKKARLAAQQLGVVPADIYRYAFEWWLRCYEAAGNRKLSDLEEVATLDGIKTFSSKLLRIAADYGAAPIGKKSDKLR